MVNKNYVQIGIDCMSIIVLFHHKNIYFPVTEHRTVVKVMFEKGKFMRFAFP